MIPTPAGIPERAWSGKRQPAHRVTRFLPPALLLALALLLWQLVTAVQRVPDWLLPGPLAIARTTFDERDLLLANAVPTLEIAVCGFLCALALGVALAGLIYYSRAVELALYPILIASQSVPIIALAPILAVILGYGMLPKLVLVCLICFFPIVVNAVDGFKSVDPDLVNLMRSLGARGPRIFRDVTLPAALPYIFSGARVAATYSVVGALVGELVGSWDGLGYVMTQKQGQLDTPALFSAMLLLTLIGIGLFTAVSIAERLLTPWRHYERSSVRQPGVARRLRSH